MAKTVKEVLSEEELKSIKDEVTADVMALAEQINFWEKVLGRQLKSAEMCYVKQMKDDNIPLSEQVIAYGITVKNCEKFSFPYFWKVLENRLNGTHGK